MRFEPIPDRFSDRLTVDESHEHLRRLGRLENVIARPNSSSRLIPVPGLEVFREHLENVQFDSLTMPGSKFYRSLIRNVSFRNSDLSNSNLCWNDFVCVDFSACTLRNADLRASEYRGVRFVDADLSGADMRMSDLIHCEFRGASMRGTKLSSYNRGHLVLSDVQRQEIAWCAASDEEQPPG